MTRKLILGLSLIIAAAGCSSAQKSHDAQPAPVAQQAPVSAPQYQHGPWHHEVGYREPAAVKAGEFNVGDIVMATTEIKWTPTTANVAEGSGAKCAVKPIARIKANEVYVAPAHNQYVVMNKTPRGELFMANVKDPKKAVFTITCVSKTPLAPKAAKKESGHRHPEPIINGVGECVLNCEQPMQHRQMKKPAAIYPIVSDKAAITDALKDIFQVTYEVEAPVPPPPPPRPAPKRIEINAPTEEMPSGPQETFTL